MHRTRASIISFVLLCLVLASSSPLIAEAKWPFRRVRPLDPAVAALIARGAASSMTLRALINTIEHSDLIVHVEQVSRPGHGLAAATRFVTRAGGHRYVRVTLYGMWSLNQTIALIGHELQHAVEVATAGWVVDQATCLELFHAIGHRTCGAQRERVCYETDAAVQAGARVWDDLHHHQAE